MTDRVHPSTQPATNAGTVNGTFTKGTTTNGTSTNSTINGAAAQATTLNPKPNLPAAKRQPYDATRRTYRPNPTRHRPRRFTCCCFFLWSVFAIIVLAVLATLVAVGFYLIIQPHRPTFTVAAVKISTLNLTSTHLTTKINLTVTTRNSNKNIVYFYDPIAVSLYTAGGDMSIGGGAFPGFTHGKKNTTKLKSEITYNEKLEDESDGEKLKNELKGKKGILLLKLQMDTKVKAKLGNFKTRKVTIRVTCEGIKVKVPIGKLGASAVTLNSKCKGDVRVKIWKWTL
ncbi:hypothetical protein ACFE04_004030 [Oxalis oulophora]